jgi:hypothetical protein
MSCGFRVTFGAKETPVASISLTPKSIAHLKPAASAFYVSDLVRRGLQVRVGSDGVKSYSVRYRFARRQRRLTLWEC